MAYQLNATVLELIQEAIGDEVAQVTAERDAALAEAEKYRALVVAQAEILDGIREQAMGLVDGINAALGTYGDEDDESGEPESEPSEPEAVTSEPEASPMSDILARLRA